MLQAAIDKSAAIRHQPRTLKLYKGNVAVTEHASKYSLYDQELVTFEEGVAYDKATPRASSSSTRCACARSASGARN